MGNLNYAQQVSGLEQVRNRVCDAVFQALNVAGSALGPENHFRS